PHHFFLFPRPWPNPGPPRPGAPEPPTEIAEKLFVSCCVQPFCTIPEPGILPREFHFFLLLQIFSGMLTFFANQPPLSYCSVISSAGEHPMANRKFLFGGVLITAGLLLGLMLPASALAGGGGAAGGAGAAAGGGTAGAGGAGGGARAGRG